MSIERASRDGELETRVGTSSGGMAIKGPPVRDGESDRSLNLAVCPENHAASIERPRGDCET